MTQPAGMALGNNNLFVCDNGLKWFDVANPAMPVLKKNFVSIQANDLIIADSVLMAIGDAGLAQYKIAGDSIYKLSLIPVIKK